MKQRGFSSVLAAASVMMFIPPVTADDNTATARLNGYQETPLTLTSPGSGEFKVRISHDETSIHFVLTYRDLVSTPPGAAVTPTQAHIHFGRPATSGQIVFFLCNTSGTPPASVPVPQACPAAPATITGTLTQMDVIARPDQGIEAGAAGFAAMVKAIRAGATYANVHTPTRPGGEIRGHIDDHRGDKHRDDHRGDNHRDK
jgi:hypothetical protein